jgi:hypothetical protein
MDWLIPWQPCIAGTPDDAIAKELASELCTRHVLYGIPVRRVAHRQDCDDCLFELLDGTGRYAVVHLTYARHPEPDPMWPETRIYEGLRHFEHECMAIEHAKWNE